MCRVSENIGSHFGDHANQRFGPIGSGLEEGFGGDSPRAPGNFFMDPGPSSGFQFIDTDNEYV
ncbi:unannotated protein [freshwater metagenome]|uniref:Unannotated protein n=1 Tax=freshwater metagenome TaxID=449393 RepID=A0A6J6HZ88_9ZZZZ